jgi:hypothetical protein
MDDKPKRIYNGVQVNFRLTDEEYVTVSQNAANVGLSVPALAKKVLLGKKISAPKIQADEARAINAELRKISTEMNRIGVNLNQIAKVANMGGCVGENELYLNRCAIEYTAEKVAELWQLLS